MEKEKKLISFWDENVQVSLYGDVLNKRVWLAFMLARYSENIMNNIESMKTDLDQDFMIGANHLEKIDVNGDGLLLRAEKYIKYSLPDLYIGDCNWDCKMFRYKKYDEGVVKERCAHLLKNDLVIYREACFLIKTHGMDFETYTKKKWKRIAKSVIQYERFNTIHLNLD